MITGCYRELNGLKVCVTDFLTIFLTQNVNILVEYTKTHIYTHDLICFGALSICKRPLTFKNHPADTKSYLKYNSLLNTCPIHVGRAD